MQMSGVLTLNSGTFVTQEMNIVSYNKKTLLQFATREFSIDLINT